MKLIESIHSNYIEERRIARLSRHLSELLPLHASVLDVGCGSGRLANRIHRDRRDLKFSGIDVLLRKKTWMPVRLFDGREIPLETNSVDVAMFVDVLHHTTDPMSLLCEAARVARCGVIIKDHLLEGVLAGPTLRMMDHIGNARYEVASPGNYWRRQQWDEAFATLRMKPVQWRESLGLYPPVLEQFFGRSLHFVTRLTLDKAA